MLSARRSPAMPETIPRRALEHKQDLSGRFTSGAGQSRYRDPGGWSDRGVVGASGSAGPAKPGVVRGGGGGAALHARRPAPAHEPADAELADQAARDVARRRAVPP